MDEHSIPAIVIASVTLYAGLYNLGIYLRRRQHREYLTFALSCLAMGLYDVFCAGLYSATSVAEGVLWQQRQVVMLALVSIVFPWFVSDYLGVTGLVPRSWRRGMWAFSAYFALAGVLGALNPFGLYWPANSPNVKEILLPWGTPITYYEMAPGPLTNVQSVLGLAAFLYALGLGIYVYRRGLRRATHPLFIALGLFFLSSVNDTAVSSGLYNFVYTMEYAYLGIVLLMTLSLSHQVAEAAAMKEVLDRDVAERQRIEETLRRYAGRLEALREIDQAILVAKSPEAIAAATLKHLRYLIPCQRASVVAIDAARGEAAISAANVDGDTALGRGTHIPLDEILRNAALEKGQASLVEDIAAFAEISPSARLLLAEGVHSHLSVPLTSQGQLIGCLCLGASAPGAFTAEHIEIATEAAAEVALALQQARLREELARHAAAAEEHVAQLEALRHVGLDLTAQLDVDSLLHSICTSAVDLLHGSDGGLYLYDPKQDALTWRIGVGANLPLAGITLQRGEGLGGKVWEQGAPLCINDYRHWDGRAHGPAALRSAAAVSAPVRWGDEFLGVLSVMSEKVGAFSQADAEMLTLFANQAAVAIRNARLYEEAQGRAERLAVLNHIAAAVGATLGLDTLLETVYRETTSIFRSDSFFIALYDESSDELDFRLQIDEGVRVPPERQPADVGITSIVVARKEPLLIRDMAQEVAALPTPQLWGTGGLPGSWLGAPMCMGERLLGVICVQSYQPRTYTDDDRLLLATIADQVATAVEKAQLYQGLHNSEERYRTLFEQANDAVFITTLQGRILEANEQACQLLGYSREELLQLTLSGLAASWAEAGPVATIDAPAQSGTNVETEYVRRDGGRVPVDIGLTRFQAAGQDLVLALVHDLSQRKQTEEQLRQAQKMEAIGTLAGGIAHDFNNILTSILGYASLVQQEMPPGTSPHHDIETIITSARRAADLTDQLLTFARRSAQVEQVSLDLNGVVREVVKLLERTIDKAIAIETHLADGLPAVRGDSSQLHQALLNLCLNARDAMPHGGRLLLETESARLGEQEVGSDLHLEVGDYVVLSVSDTGHGIDPAVRDRIFEPFFTTKEHGRGLGLAMVYGIVRGHGGAIHLYSERGQGTTFKVYLPAHQDQGTPAPQALESAPGGNETILVIDDEEEIRHVLQRILARGGYSVLVAADGAQGLDLYRQHRAEIDMVILDVVMPRMSGQEAFRRLWEINPEVKVLLSSGYSENGQVGNLLSWGAQGFLQKPYDVAMVLRRVRQTLDAQPGYAPQ